MRPPLGQQEKESKRWLTPNPREGARGKSPATSRPLVWQSNAWRPRTSFSCQPGFAKRHLASLPNHPPPGCLEPGQNHLPKERNRAATI